MGKKDKGAVEEIDIDNALDDLFADDKKVAVVEEEKKPKATKQVKAPVDELDEIMDEPTPAKSSKKHASMETSDLFEMDMEKITIPDKTLRVIPNEEVEELAASIKIDGLLQPILVNKDGELLAGYRRYLAHEKLKMKTIKANVVDYSKDERYRVSLIENLQRKQLSVPEEAKAYVELLKDKKRFPHQKDLAKALGIGERKITYALKAIGESEEYEGATQKREVKKAEHTKTTVKTKRMSEENLPEGMTVLVSKHELNIGLKLKVKSDIHAKSFDIKKELAALLKEITPKEFAAELQILREDL